MLDLTKLPIGTRLRTRGGYTARLLANDVKGIAPCVIAADVGAGMEQLHNVDADGAISERTEHPHDIVGIERPKHRVRVTICRRHDGEIYVVTFRESDGDWFSGPAQALAYGNSVIADQIVEIEETGDA